MLRQQLYYIIEHDNDKQSIANKAYDIVMFIVIALSIFPLMFRTQ